MSSSTMSHAHPTEHAHDPSRGQQVGVILLIVADAAFVLSLVFTYFYLRGLDTEGAWIPKGSHTLGIGSGWLVAGVMVLSAVAYLWGERGIRAGNQRQLAIGVGLALLLVLADFVIQLIRMLTLPFLTTTGSYASTVITFAGSHLVHLLITAVLGVAIWNRGRRGLFTRAQNWHVRLVGYWWAWVAAAAVLMAITASFVGSPHAGL